MTSFRTPYSDPAPGTGAARRRPVLRRPGGSAVLATLAALILSGCVTVPREYGDDVELVRTSCAVPGAWYAGDLHCHTTYSDGDSPVATVIARAEERGLDFLAITDHDTSMNGLPVHWNDPHYRSERMILLYGVEWTTSRGHANVLATRPFGYASLWLANRELAAADAVDSARQQGAIFSINHPVNSRCDWEYGFTDPSGAFLADTLEVWNGPYVVPSRNHRSTRELWDELLSQGLRVTGVGGSDNHQTRGIQSHFNLHGAPTTWVHATARTADAIMEGIHAGHVSLSYQPYADRLEFLADADGDGAFEVMMGDEIPGGRETTFCVAVMGAYRRETGMGRGQLYSCAIYKNGKVFARVRLRESAGEAVTFVDTPQEGDYYRAVLRGAPRVGVLQRLTTCRTLAVTNPIYVR